LFPTKLMDIEALKEHYDKRKLIIEKRLKEFSSRSQEQQFHEFLFCTLTPQSNARRCWGKIP